MRVEWGSGETKATNWFTVHDAEVAEDYGGTRFVPQGVTITVTTYHQGQDDDDDGSGQPEPDPGLAWRATVKGPIIKADGKPGVRMHEARYWHHHTHTPPWLRTLAERCIANGAEVPW